MVKIGYEADVAAGTPTKWGLMQRKVMGRSGMHAMSDTDGGIVMVTPANADVGGGNATSHVMKTNTLDPHDHKPQVSGKDSSRADDTEEDLISGLDKQHAHGEEVLITEDSPVLPGGVPAEDSLRLSVPEPDPPQLRCADSEVETGQMPS